MIQVVLQCRQKPDTFKIQGETMRFRSTGQSDVCPHVKVDEVEWVTEHRKSLMPYGILIRTFSPDQEPARYFRSPNDPNPLF
mmetsp:Transcript_73799/g.238958  ORF Transcript_73799/g.238958 Transcript_73799/m.238958 type:complete len:82 (-) Transcript_73799:292-537(-)